MFNWFKKKTQEQKQEEKSYITYNNAEEYYLLAITFGWTLEEISKLSWNDKYELKRLIKKENELLVKELSVKNVSGQTKELAKEIGNAIKDLKEPSFNGGIN